MTNKYKFESRFDSQGNWIHIKKEIQDKEAVLKKIEKLNHNKYKDPAIQILEDLKTEFEQFKLEITAPTVKVEGTGYTKDGNCYDFADGGTMTIFADGEVTISNAECSRRADDNGDAIISAAKVLSSKGIVSNGIEYVISDKDWSITFEVKELFTVTKKGGQYMDFAINLKSIGTDIIDGEDVISSADFENRIMILETQLNRYDELIKNLEDELSN